MFRFSTLVFLLLALTFHSCSDLQITKRKYRPGFHVQMRGSAEQVEPTVQTRRPKTKAENISAASETVFVAGSDTISSQTESEPEEQFWASTEETPAFLNIDLENQLILETKRVKRAKALSFVRPEKDEPERSKFSIIGFCLSIFFFLFWWIAPFMFSKFSSDDSRETHAALFGILIPAHLGGVAGLVTSMIGQRETKRGKKKGRAMATTGMIWGIVITGLSFLSLLLFAIWFGLTN